MPTFVRTQEIEHEIGPSGHFGLRVTSPDVELRAVEGGIASARIRFELRASTESEAEELFERVRFRVREGAGTLEISEPDEGDSGIASIARLFGMSRLKADVSVAVDVPSGADLSYSGVSADLTATGFGGSQQYRTVSGDLVLHQLAGEVRVQGVSSDVSVRADDPLRLEMNTVSGDISVFAPRFDQLRIVTVSGDVELEGQLAPGGEHRIETVSGDLSLGVVGGLALEVRGLSTDVDISLPHRAEGSRDRRRYLVGDGEAHLLFSSMSGDVSAGRSRRHTAAPQGNPPAPPSPGSPPPTAPAPLPDDEELAILRALERGEIDVEEASRRLAPRTTDV